MYYECKTSTMARCVTCHSLAQIFILAHIVPIVTTLELNKS